MRLPILALLALASGCGSSEGSDAGAPDAGAPRGVDLLLVVDNSRGMRDEQQLFVSAAAELVESLASPRCVDAAGRPVGTRPQTPTAPCPAGSAREHEPVTDLHVGVISTSLGGHGSDSCGPDSACGANTSTSTNDRAHLLDRRDPCAADVVPTYEGRGFLAWDPEARLSPPGEPTLGSASGGTGLLGALSDLIEGVGTLGCSFEAQHESWYRFLVDPEPYESIPLDSSGRATPTGTDAELLAQRAAFLRPDSLLLIVVLSDEDDCSIREYGQFYFVAQARTGSGATFHLPAPRTECATNPNDPCCLSCGQSPGSCPADPTCRDAGGRTRYLPDLDDALAVRCLDNKRRFGIDFLYPMDRYVTGLTASTVPNRAGELVASPIFSDLDPSDDRTHIRSARDVVLATIVGVPWQDLALSPTDISQGLVDSGSISWDVILANGSSPTDAHMIASIEPRAGLAPPGSPAGTDPIHGHEYTISQRDDLQYACTFPLPAARDCSTGAESSCDCEDPANDRPNCEGPGATGARTLQSGAAAYPGTRHLTLARGLGQNAVVAPICAAQTSDPLSLGHGHRPAVDAILRRIATILP